MPPRKKSPTITLSYDDLNRIVSERIAAAQGQAPVPAADGEARLTEAERRKNAEVIAAAPKEAVGDRPGEYKTVGHDAKGEPIKAKVPWTKEKMEQVSPMHLRMPMTTVPVQVDNARYNLVAGEEQMLPDMIWEIYQGHLRATKRFNEAYQPLTAEEDRQVTTGALKNKMAWSRVVRIDTGPLPPEEVPAEVPSNE